MNMDTLHKLTDPELAQVIHSAQELLQTRAEKRKADAMEQIRQLAASVQINVKFDAGRKPKANRVMLKAGDCYVNPSEPGQSYVVGKGKPPRWFVALREKNRLPAPTPADATLIDER